MIDYLWEHLCTIDMPPIDELTRDRRESLEVLDMYIRDCLEEWFVYKEGMSAISIVRLSNSSHELMLKIRQMGGSAPLYFEDLRNLCQRVLHQLHVREARQKIAHACKTSANFSSIE